MDWATSSSRAFVTALLGGAVAVGFSASCGGQTSDPGVDGGSSSSASSSGATVSTGTGTTGAATTGSTTVGSSDVASTTVGATSTTGTTAATGPGAGAGGANDVATTGTGSGAGGTSGMGGANVGGAGGASGADFSLCMTNTSCVLRPKSCCGACGATTRTDFVAINRASASAYANTYCGGNVPCLACYMAQDPNLVATCGGGRCAMVDLHAESLTACNTGADCRVRTNECCECNGKTDREHLVAVSIAGAAQLHDLICDATTACAKCLPAYPPEATPACDQGHCIIKYTN